MRIVTALLLVLAWSGAGRQARLFELHSAFWINLHHYLHALARPNGPLRETLPAATTPAEHDAWNAAVATYRERYGRRSLLFDDLLVRAKLALVAADAGAQDPPGDRDLPEPMREALRAAAPVYRRHVWAAHADANRVAIAEAERLLARHGAAIAPRLAASYGDAWPSTPIRVDVVHDAGPPGNAYTLSAPTHVTIAAADPRHSGLHLLEVLFHEASHRWDATLISEIEAAARQQDVAAAGDLWHALLFFNAGAITADALRDAGVAGFEMYADKERLFAGRWASWRPVIAAHWMPFLAGARTRQDVIAAIVRDLAPKAAHERPPAVAIMLTGAAVADTR
jgi:hypothetical protein